MSFALCPVDGLPRLWRFVAPGVLPEDVLSTLDKKQNLLVINKELFDQLSEIERYRVLRTHEKIVAVHRF